MPDIRLERISKRFGDFTAVDDLDIVLPANSVTCLLGPSGCGKTTLMRMIAGLEKPSEGRVLFGERDVTPLRARDRRLGMVFQYPVMYATLTVAENIELPLRRERGMTAATRRERVDEILEILGMADRAGARIGELDAGSRQKVAVGRAICRHSDVVLFDEPTTNVEVNAKLQLIRAFKEVTRRLRQTIVYVTHDQTEAMTLADNIALMKAGRIVQYASPREIYNDCDSEFGGWFLGNPGMSFIVREVAPGGVVDLPFLSSALPVPEAVSGSVTAGIRPEAVGLQPEPDSDTVAARILSRAIGIGGQYIFKLDFGGETLKAKVPRVVASKLHDDHVHVRCRAQDVALFQEGQRLQSNESTTNTVGGVAAK